jgi:predicted TIM-barrel fold metal-dependent hydrolase
MRRLHDLGVRGVRFNLVEETGGGFDRKGFDTVAARCARLGWPVCLHIPGDKVVELADLWRRAPTNLIFDHFGRVEARKGVDQPQFRALLDLMGEKHMWCKISGIDRQVQKGSKYEDVPPLAHALLKVAPDRLIWGTDWPHSSVYEIGRMANDGDLVNALLDLVPDEAARHKVLVDNPGRLFDFS